MPVSEQTPYEEYIANGVSTRFPLGFMCKDSKHLIVKVADQEALPGEWFLDQQDVVFYTAPKAESVISIKRNTPLARTTKYSLYDNSFRPQALNEDMDFVWLKMQELLVEKNLLEIKASKDDEFLKEFLLQVITDAGLQMDQLRELFNSKNYAYDQLITTLKNAINTAAAAGAGANGWTAQVVLDASGKNQQEINDRAVDLTLLLIPNNSSSAAKALNSAVIRQAIITAKAANKKIKSDLIGTIHIEGDFNFKNIRVIKFYTDIINATGAVIVGGFANTGEPVDIHFGRITNGSSALSGPIPSIDTFRVEGIKAGTITVGDTNLIRVHAIGGDLRSGSNAYFRIFLDGVVRAFRISDEGSRGWNNEFEVRGGRLIDLDITGTGYVPNNIVFDNNVWEGSLVKIRFKRAWTNRITNARFEDVGSSLGIIFESDTMQNTVIKKWAGTGATRSMFDVSIPVVNLGEGNQVTTQNAIEYNQVEILSISPNTLILANSTDSAYADSRIAKMPGLLPKALLSPSLFGFGFPAQRNIVTSEIIAVEDGDAVKFDCEYEGKLLRPSIYIYDENQELITTGTGHINMIGGIFNSSEGLYSVDADLGAEDIKLGFSITSNSVKYIRLGIYAGTSGFVRNITATLFTQKLSRSKAENMAMAVYVLPELNGLVTQGFAPRGTRYLNTQDKKIYSCVLSLDTSVSAIDGSIFTLRNTIGVQVGDIIGLARKNGYTAWGTVTAVNGLKVTISNPSDVAVGARCVINRWRSYDKQASGLTATSTTAQIVAALQVAGLAT